MSMEGARRDMIRLLEREGRGREEDGSIRGLLLGAVGRRMWAWRTREAEQAEAWLPS